jgi:hypothetical protein
MTPEKVKFLAEFSEHTVYLMGGSFMLGSLFTILLLLLLDFVRQAQMERRDVDDAEE